ncbi:MAG: hypothetical protein LQ339_000807 [Xanthoria mediterranea]|nr:MAG: hypothetical protein LQ339_000807 [Xanthoria mediterranea]
MPYTPPSHRSPATSEPTSPGGTSSNKQQRDRVSNAPSTSAPALPHSSSSYLNRRRRSPSIKKPVASFSVGPDEKYDETLDGSADGKPNGSAATSNLNKGFLQPNSSQNSSDDDGGEVGRGRIRDPPNLAELQAAIMLIEQHRESSPARVTEERLKARATLGLKMPRLDPLAKEHAERPEMSSPLPLSAAARKISHSRSNTDMSALLDIPRDFVATPTRSASESDLDDLDDETVRNRRTPVRKKSGELVKPVLSRGGLRRRPSSMPGTPTYGKAVHFDCNSLENVRTFNHKDRPIVVSTGTSPAEQYASEIEFPFGDGPSTKRAPAYEWEIRLTNFPRETPERKTMPVRVERIYLSADNKNLMGAVAVANLAFHKRVVVRFTLDYWKTTSEVVADYNSDVRRKLLNDGCDRFLFSIKLEDQAKLEDKTMFFCVRYNVNGQELWDNNSSLNYQVDFAKKVKSETKQGTQGTSLALPRSKPSHSTSSVRPRSFPSAMDDFGDLETPFDLSLFQPPPAQVIGDSPIRYKSQKATSELAADEPLQRSTGSNKAFGGRYNFGVSLHNAIAAASPTLGERGDPNFGSSGKPSTASALSFAKQGMVESASDPSMDRSAAAGKEATKNPDPRPAALTAEKPSLQSKSYQELLNSYCFYGSSKSSQKPQATGEIKSQRPAQVDGPGDEPDEPKPEPANVPTEMLPKPQPNEENKAPSRITSPRSSRSHTPLLGSDAGSRATSPVPFGFHQYTQPIENGFLTESHPPTAIRG